MTAADGDRYVTMGQKILELTTRLAEVERERDEAREENKQWGEIAVSVQEAIGPGQVPPGSHRTPPSPHSIPPMNFDTAIHQLRRQKEAAERDLAAAREALRDMIEIVQARNSQGGGMRLNDKGQAMVAKAEATLAALSPAAPDSRSHPRPRGR